MIDEENLVGLERESYSTALAILSYLAQHPKATDTVRGIARFWLKGEFMTDKVEEIVTELVERELVRRTLKLDGGHIYGAPRDLPPDTPEGGAAS